MKLRELLCGRGEWMEDETIYVVEPWSSDADALLSSDSPDTNGPIIQSGKCYTYFLEGFIARDLLDDLDTSDDVGEAAVERLIRFAIYDA